MSRIFPLAPQGVARILPANAILSEGMIVPQALNSLTTVPVAPAAALILVFVLLLIGSIAGAVPG